MGFWDVLNPFNWFRSPAGAFDPVAQRQRFLEHQEKLYNERRQPGSPDYRTFYRTLLDMGIRPPIINPMLGELGMPQGALVQNNSMAYVPNFNSYASNISNLGTPTSELMSLLETTDGVVKNVQQSLAAQRMNGRPGYA
jgi:hypothetical protein